MIQYMATRSYLGNTIENKAKRSAKNSGPMLSMLWLAFLAGRANWLIPKNKNKKLQGSVVNSGGTAIKISLIGLFCITKGVLGLWSALNPQICYGSL